MKPLPALKPIPPRDLGVEVVNYGDGGYCDHDNGGLALASKPVPRPVGPVPPCFPIMPEPPDIERRRNAPGMPGSL